ncbi:MAG TPA: hypothetical protein VHL98_10970 [Microvirga sp.]|jgi:hypothetical protein|nr:hypothetical protein [Microvirga sp.]
MSLFQVTHGLNREGQEDVIRRARGTHVGMAHFAGTGPAGRTCRECVFWMKTSTWFAEGGKNGGGPRPAPCARYQQLTHQRGGNVPHGASACRHFAAADHPQPMQRPRRAGEHE